MKLREVAPKNHVLARTRFVVSDNAKAVRRCLV